VAFPDDDASYPPATLRAAAASMAANLADVLCGVYLPADGVLDTGRFPSVGRPLTPKMAPGVVSSNNLFLSAKAVQEVGKFDEQFGLGARFGSSEDVDFTFRALFAGYHGWYDPQVAIYHPYKGHRPAEYFKGNLAVVGKHILRQPRVLAKPLYHALRWGGHLVRLGDLSPMGYLGALGAMLSALR
jgi:GT2 family glycosyltransferase